jgi:hypothetical protein
MSSKELKPLQTLSRVLKRRLTQAQAAEQLGLALGKWNGCAAGSGSKEQRA